MPDKINPPHYKQLKDVDSIRLMEQFNFCLGNAIKYIVRCDHKGEKETDLKKAIWFLERELSSIKLSNRSGEGMPYNRSDENTDTTL
jgi:hypothetical protein